MYVSINPYNREVVGRWDTHSLQQAEKLAERSQSAFIKWKSLTLDQRIAYIKTVKNILTANSQKWAALITIEMGKPIQEAEAEVLKCAQLCTHLEENAGLYLESKIIRTEASYSAVHYEPLGVILAIMPWNFPFWQVFRFSVATLLAGNVIILKHAPNVQHCAEAILSIFEQAGVEKGVFTNIRLENEDIARWIESEKIKGVALTGSMYAGQKVAQVCGRALKKCLLELGGSDAFIVLNDADVPKAAQEAAAARLGNAGQVCISAKRFIVEKRVKEDFIQNYILHTSRYKMGNPTQPETTLGPLARPDIVDTLMNQYEKLRNFGKVLLEPSVKDGFVSPGLVQVENFEHGVCQEELFGPIATLAVASDAQNAVALARQTSYGLSASIWTCDTALASHIAYQLEVGSVFVNARVRSDPRLPIGGVKNSGYGRELGHLGIVEFTNAKTIYIQ